MITDLVEIWRDAAESGYQKSFLASSGGDASTLSFALSLAMIKLRRQSETIERLEQEVERLKCRSSNTEI